jgi:prepilin signal peptidase PulO-like enzyme (type II secretory pathway)
VLGVEVATGSAFGVAALRFGWSPTLVPVLVLAAGLVAASTVDLACSRIPTRFVHLTGAGLVASISLVTLVDGEPSRLVGAGVGAATALGLLGAFYLAVQMLGGGGVGSRPLCGARVQRGASGPRSPSSPARPHRLPGC